MNLIWDLHHLDQRLTLSLNALGGGAGDWIWPLFSNKEVWFLLYAVLALMLFVRLGWKRALVVLACVGLTIGACDQFSNLIKDSVARLRPSYDSLMLRGGLRVLEWRGNNYGFFSAHAANSVGLAVGVVTGFRNDRRLRYRGLAWGMGLWALLVSLSRVFVGKHFFGDVLVGIVVGLLIGGLFGWIARRIIARMDGPEQLYMNEKQPIKY
ncbi:MAG: phosphatase PAP2 family protein [Bacteroidales bacterium]|nr:phosphatase PAP2 family protein [Bacteroidales bacterium]